MWITRQSADRAWTLLVHRQPADLQCDRVEQLRDAPDPVAVAGSHQIFTRAPEVLAGLREPDQPPDVDHRERVFARVKLAVNRKLIHISPLIHRRQSPADHEDTWS